MVCTKSLEKVLDLRDLSWLPVVVSNRSKWCMKIAIVKQSTSRAIKGIAESNRIDQFLAKSVVSLIILLFFLYLLSGFYPKRILHIFEDFVSIIVFALQTDIARLRTQSKLYTYFLN